MSLENVEAPHALAVLLIHIMYGGVMVTDTTTLIPLKNFFQPFFSRSISNAGIMPNMETPPLTHFWTPHSTGPSNFFFVCLLIPRYQRGDPYISCGLTELQVHEVPRRFPSPLNSLS
jgi:hypothetical protein